MATFTFTIPSDKLTRLSNSLDKVGYKFDPTSGVSDTNQRIAYAKARTIAEWQNWVFTFERQQVIDAGGNPATQNKNFVPLTDVTAA